MKIKEITDFLETLAPLPLQESYDNAGLIIGQKQLEVKGVLVCLDVTEQIMDEAISNNCNLIIAHHPLVFGGLKKFTGKNYVERTLIKAIRNNVAVYAAHTNLDNVLKNGVNGMITQKIGLTDVKVLSPMPDKLNKLVVYVPEAQSAHVRQALFDAGAGCIGNYDQCSYNLQGNGTFRAGPDANPYTGHIGEQHTEYETRIEVVVPHHLISSAITALLAVHPYEEPAFDIIPIANSWVQAGSGAVGNLPKPENAHDFLLRIKSIFDCKVIRHTRLPERSIERVAVCGGAGSFLINDARAVQADILLTADIKYHQFFDAEYPFVLADIGHYESEQFTKELIGKLLKDRFSNLNPLLTSINTNPINYL